ncbi:hypothetical protein EDB82DRAFT_448533, partial [Fusarium venenatum]|uniref:uncharacterized protein n=1 Tax=Fusarium venenatum TaxID=56646 RepID=UPI001D1AF775
TLHRNKLHIIIPLCDDQSWLLFSLTAITYVLHTPFHLNTVALQALSCFVLSTAWPLALVFLRPAPSLSFLSFFGSPISVLSPDGASSPATIDSSVPPPRLSLPWLLSLRLQLQPFHVFHQPWSLWFTRQHRAPSLF